MNIYEKNNIGTKYALRSTTRKRVLNGEASDEEIREYLENTKATLDAETMEFQRQLDEWRADQGE